MDNLQLRCGVDGRSRYLTLHRNGTDLVMLVGCSNNTNKPKVMYLSRQISIFASFQPAIKIKKTKQKSPKLQVPIFGHTFSCEKSASLSVPLHFLGLHRSWTPGHGGQCVGTAGWSFPSHRWTFSEPESGCSSGPQRNSSSSTSSTAGAAGEQPTSFTVSWD